MKETKEELKEKEYKDKIICVDVEDLEDEDLEISDDESPCKYGGCESCEHEEECKADEDDYEDESGEPVVCLSKSASGKLRMCEEPHFAFVLRRVADDYHGNYPEALSKFAVDKKVLGSWSTDTPYPVIRSDVGDEASGWAKSAVSQLMMKFSTPSDVFAADKLIDGERFLKVTKDNLQMVLKYEYKMMHQVVGNIIDDIHSIVDPVDTRDIFKRLVLETKGIWIVLVSDDEYSPIPFDVWIDKELQSMMKSPDKITGFIYRIEGVLEYAIDEK